jgi:Holliday junction resolvase RusA-like endonuclease
MRYHAYKDQLNYALPGYELPETLRIEFHIAMPRSWSSKKKASMRGQYHTQKPDIDNLVKGFMDAFHTDDAHVAILHAGKYWCAEGEAACIVLDKS